MEADGVVLRPEDELPGSDELLIAAGHPDLDRVVPVGFEGGRAEAQPRGDLPDLLGRLEDVGAVLGPQLLDGLTAEPGVGLVPEGDVTAGQVLRVDVGHCFSSTGVSVLLRSWESGRTATIPRGE
nr:hypothetical protein GCM10020093_076520 [Planobispora longispora]